MLLIQLSLIPQTFAADAQWRPSYLADVPLVLDHAGEVPVGRTLIAYDLRYEDDLLNFPMSASTLRTLTQEAYALSVRTARSLSLPVSDCKPDLDVHIVQLTYETMQRPGFASFRTMWGKRYSALHGLYDPTVHVRRESVLAFTVGANLHTERVFVHELGHYWYDRWCLYDAKGPNTEVFAEAVEQAYMNPF